MPLRSKDADVARRLLSALPLGPDDAGAKVLPHKRGESNRSPPANSGPPALSTQLCARHSDNACTFTEPAMKIGSNPQGSVRTRDVWAAGLKLGRDIAKLDPNRDGVITQREAASGEKRLGLDAAERKMISQVLAAAIPERGGASSWSASIIPPYAAEHLAGLDTKDRGLVKAKDLSKLTFPKGEGRHAIDRVATRLAPDVFEYVQAEEKAGKKL